VTLDETDECPYVMLLVEDDPDLAIATSRTLRTLAYAIGAAFDVATATHLARTRAFDLILCDGASFTRRNETSEEPALCE
jgi:response regulator RpfG family c-di-GMP phosphodiesterase